MPPLNIVPLARGTGAPAGSEVNSTRSASQERIDRAKAVATGQNPDSIQNQQHQQSGDREQQNVRRIKMRTQRSIYRDNPVSNEAVSPESNIPDASEQAQTTAEDTRPLSPQFAALAKAKRALQEKERALLAKEQELAKSAASVPTDHIPVSALQSNPLGILLENGVTYDQLIEAVEAGQQQPSPAVSKLEAEIKAIKEGLENQNKSLSDREEAQKQQVLNQMEREAAQLVAAQGDQFEMVREKKAIKDVRRLIEKTYDTTGEVLEVSEALQLVEDALLDDALALARIQKVQSKLTPAQQQTQQQKIQQPGVRVMRTLTSRDGVSAPTSARERAIAAFHGRKL